MKQQPGDELLTRLGARVRAERIERGLTIRELAEASGLSPRFLSDVENGRSNISITRLQALAQALGLSISSLVAPPARGTRAALLRLVQDCPEPSLPHACEAMELALGKRRPSLVGLLGVRGAGKSTIGGRLARALELPFVELTERIEARAGMPVADIFTLHGEPYYRRLELACLEELLSSGQHAVVALPGGIVTHEAAFARVRSSCTSIWLRARAEDYWDRVFAQGDTRPMAGRENAMEELRELVAHRAPLYARADLVADTAQDDPDEVVDQLVQQLEAASLRP